MNNKIPHPFTLLVCLMLMVGLACNISSNGTVPPTQTPGSLPHHTHTPKPPTSTATTHSTLPHHTHTPTPTDTSTPTSTPTSTNTVSHKTHTPTPTDTSTPTSTPTSTNTLMHHITIVVPPVHIITIITPTDTSLPLVIPPVHLIPIIPAQTTLDYTANANYGEANLSAGFAPDPYSVGMTSGGDVDVSYLGASCSGFATSAPDLRVNFGGGGSALLRFYFIGSNGDPTMIVNDPYGNYYCVDDSFGTVNPTIDFNNPAGGTYDLWIGSYSSGTSIAGTMYVTANSGNHP